MPTVARFAGGLGELGAREREELLAVADAVAAHRFDLLGSGPVDLGAEIDWERDFKNGRSWPLDHISRLPIVYPDGSDIKVPWELSRFQHLPVLAAAWRLTRDARYIEEIGAQLHSWIDSNPVEFGPNWACTMDVAIRAANWVAALALMGDAAARAPWAERVLESLLLHGRFIRSHPEWADIRGNHYLSDVVGLLPVAALFGAGREGQTWLEWAAAELEREIEHQVRADGCDHEASIPYHRLVTELFVCGTQAVEALVPDRLPASHRERLRAMLAFTRDYTRPDGLAPQIGDADDGRFLPLGDYGRADPRSHLHLFDQAGVAYEPAELEAPTATAATRSCAAVRCTPSSAVATLGSAGSARMRITTSSPSSWHSARSHWSWTQAATSIRPTSRGERCSARLPSTARCGSAGLSRTRCGRTRRSRSRT